jgi:lipopolysaccharide export system protein LptA
MKRGSRAALIAAAVAYATSAGQAHAQKVAPPQAGVQSAAPSAGFGLGGEDNGKPINIEAENGVEWQQNNRVYIARGNAKATRGETTVTADTLYAYYRPPQPNSLVPASGGPVPPKSESADGSNQIYRLEADGHVVFSTPTQNAYGDHAVYDLDQTLLVMTGNNLKIVTPQDVVTARDSLEWYDQKQLGVARGNALAVRQGPAQKSVRGDAPTQGQDRGQKSIRGDVLIAEMSKPANQPSKISKIDAQGHVILTSLDEIAHGDTAVYNLDTGIATLSGSVTLTKGENEMRGQYGVVDTNNNVARLLPAPPSAQLTGPPQRVQGLLIPPPRDQAGTAKPQPGATKP